VTDIKQQDVTELNHGQSHISYNANRTLGVLQKMFNLAEAWCFRPDGSSPCLHLKKYDKQKGVRFPNPEKCAELGKAQLKGEHNGFEIQSSVDAIQILILIGCRLGEIATLRRAHLALKACELRLSDSKTEAKIMHFGKTAADVRIHDHRHSYASGALSRREISDDWQAARPY